MLSFAGLMRKLRFKDGEMRLTVMALVGADGPRATCRTLGFKSAYMSFKDKVRA